MDIFQQYAWRNAISQSMKPKTWEGATIMNAEIEKIATNRYRLRFRGQVMTVDAQALRELMDWCSLYVHELEDEAKAALREEAESKGWDVQALADHIVTGDTTIYRGGNDE